MMIQSKVEVRNPPGYEIDFDLLQEFERGLNPSSPEHSNLPCRVLGYGEISTVLEIQVDGLRDLAFKRMSIFETAEELARYVKSYREYNRLLEEEIGQHVPSQGYAAITEEVGRPIFYIIQEKLSSSSIGNNAIKILSREGTITLYKLILQHLNKVWEFNQRQTDRQIAIDGQISNWSIDGFDPQDPLVNEEIALSYVDTSTPIFRIEGIEQLDPELFLRAAPSFLVWALRLFFLDDVMNRYYSLRKVVVDLTANFYKEQMPELIPELVAKANEFFKLEAVEPDLEPIRVEEVRAYYREDAMIWSLYQSMRIFDRFLHRYLLRKEYPYILPGEVRR